MGVASGTRWRHQAAARVRSWENKREQHSETQEGSATDAQTENINLRSTPWWWNGRNGAQVKSVGFAAY